MTFTHLHIHTHYSLLDGLTKVPDLVSKIKDEGGKAVAITDHGVMYGVIEFYQECKKQGIKPIIGVETYVAPNGRHNKRAKVDEKNYHLILLAKNNTGYKNLIKLVSKAHLEGFYYKPRIDEELLEKYHEGLIAMTACIQGEIPVLILSGQEDKAREKILYYKNLFGSDSFYLELQYHSSLPGQETVNQSLIKLGKELNVGLVATNDAHYLDKEDDEAQDVLLCLQTKKKKKDTGRMNMLGDDYSIKPARQMIEEFKDAPEAIENTNKIAQMCNVEIKLGEYQLPHFQVPNNKSDSEYLKELCCQGAQERYIRSFQELDEEKKKRLDYELDIISKMGFASYFLIVADFVKWAKDQNIVVGPGRGSAAGSFASYLLGITNIDPLQYDLLFERFLNPARISMPDVDLDFADIRRDEVIKYVESKYGKDHVAQIITFSTMAARAAVRDVGRVLDYPYDYCDKIAKAIPMGSTIEKALKTPELRELYQNEKDAKEIIDYAKTIEGVIRHASVHACGVLITKEPVVEYAPVQYVTSEESSAVSQYSLHPVEDLGLLKMDFLGLSNLTIIESAIYIIENTRGIEIDIDKIPLDDKKTFELLQKGETTGVFQLESSGMRRYLKELSPNNFEDVIAMVALYRPGPMEWIPDFIDGKHGRKKPKYLHPKLEPILAKTYGVAMYQEQVMQISRDLAGFSMGEADILRKAVGKKIPKLLEEQRDKFIDGCVKNGIPSELAKEIFSFIEPFAGYGFNRSHAACYALIGYQTAYLKANYPTEFMAALMTSDQENIDRIPIEIEECQAMGIEVLGPDINESFANFTVVTSGTAENKAVTNQESKIIRFGLRAVKNVGAHITDVIIAERKANGPYKDIADFLSRAQDKDLNKKSLESLIKVGAFDKLEERGKLLANLEKMLEYSRGLTQARDTGQDSLFSLNPELSIASTITLTDAPSADKKDILAWEKELMGFYISDHPFNEYGKVLGKSVIPLSNVNMQMSGKFISVGGVVSNIKKIVTRSNENMLFVKIEDKLSNIEILVFPSTLKETPDLWQDGQIIICRGKVSAKDNELKIICDKVKKLDSDNVEKIGAEFAKMNKGGGVNSAGGIGAQCPSTLAQVKGDEMRVFGSQMPLKIKIDNTQNQELLEKLKQQLSTSKGDSKVIFYIKNGSGEFNIIETGFKVDNNGELRGKLVELLGEGAVK